MKTALTYGFYMALAGAFLFLGLFFGGFHDDPEKMGLAQTIGTIGGLAISILAILMGVREKRALTPDDQKWGYGSAFGTAFLIGLFGTLIAVIFNYTYFFHINPGFSDLVLQAELAKIKDQAPPQEAIDAAEPIIKRVKSSTVKVAIGGLFGVIGNTVLALIIAAFCKKRPKVAPSPGA